ncbi:MAG: hypothetical protein AB7F98_04090, partial [Novosphingobium sp.]
MLADAWQIRVPIYYSVFIPLQLLALWRGASPERCVVGVNVGMVVVDRLYHLAIGGPVHFAIFDIGHFLIDLAAFAALSAVALKANRFYPICLAAIQLLAVTSHIVRAINPAVGGLVYAILILAPSYLLTAVFGAGMAWHLLHRRQRAGTPSWLTSSGHLPVKRPGMSQDG